MMACDDGVSGVLLQLGFLLTFLVAATSQICSSLLLLCWCWEYLALLINEVEVFIRTA